MPRIQLFGLLLSVVLLLFLVSIVNCTQLSAEEQKAKYYEHAMAYTKDQKF